MEREPSITAKALVEFIYQSPAVKRSSLRKQKFPLEGDGKHQIPYYAAVSAAVRHYFKAGNNPRVLVAARSKALSTKSKSKRENVLRAISAFETSALRARSLKPVRNARHATVAYGLTLRANPEMTAMDGPRRVHAFFHFGAQALDGGKAQLLADVLHWVISQDGTLVRGRGVEIWDVAADRVITARERAADTALMVRDNARAVLDIWETLDPYVSG